MLPVFRLTLTAVKSMEKPRFIMVAPHTPFLRYLLLPVVFFLASLGTTQAQYSESQEFDFANKLIDMGFRDYAVKVIDSLSSSSRNKGLRTLFDGRILMGKGDFEGAETKFKEADDGEPKYKMLMRLGDVHYTNGKTKKTGSLYEYVFSRYKTVPTNDRERQFYLESAYKYFKLMQMPPPTSSSSARQASTWPT